MLLTILLSAAMLLVACGQVVTPRPTQASLSIDTPTPPPARTMPPSTTAPAVRPLPDTTTPTVTPTPIVHVVKKGDTLQAIAFDFGVSVEALQTANGIENPQFLQIGQRLVIPVLDEAGERTPGLLLPTPTPHPIQVHGMAFYETPVDSLLGLGEVANTTMVTLTNVLVEVTLLNANGEPVIEANTFVSMDIIPSGERSPFGVLFEAPPREWNSYQVDVVRGQEAGALASGYVPITVVQAKGNPSGPQFRVEGAVANASAHRAARSVDVIITTYDAEGSVTGFRRSAVAMEPGGGALPPGAELAFSASMTAHGGVPADFSVGALGYAEASPASGG